MLQYVITKYYMFPKDASSMVYPSLERFSEWSQAAWDIQKGFLLGEDDAKDWDLHFMSLHHESDCFMDPSKDLITGRAMREWWDKSQESGPPARNAEAFAVDLPALDCLCISNDGEVKIL